MLNVDPEDLSKHMHVDEKVASVAARLTEQHHSDDLENEDLFEELERELENNMNMGALREKKMKELKQEIDKVRDMREKEHGKYSEIVDEKEVIRVSASEARCVIHFYHRNFQRCKIMDKHLEAIAPRHFYTRFARVFVENVPWLVEKLDIKVLPCVMCFVDGMTKDRIIGFEELGNQDGFETSTLEIRLSLSGTGVLQKPKTSDNAFAVPHTIRKSIRDQGDDDEVFDLDE